MNNLTPIPLWVRRIAGRATAAVVLLTSLALGVSSCNKDQNPVVPSAPKAADPTMKRLLGMGFAPANIVDKGTYYLVENDIVFDKQAPAQAVPTQPGIIVLQQDQASTYNLITYDRQPYVTVRIDNSSFPSQWNADVAQAIADWNGIPGCRVDLTLTSSGSADITIKGGSMAQGYYGSSQFPANGAPGYEVVINRNDAPDYRRRTTIVHEIGHCLGFRHTDLYENGEGSGDVGGVIINGTPMSDPNSVMNSGSSPNRQQPWVGFSTSDVTGFQNLYPIYAGTIGTGNYKIVNRNSGKVLDVSGGNSSIYNDTRIVQWSSDGYASKQWYFVSTGDDHYRIMNRNSNLAIDVRGGTGSTGNEEPIVQYQFNGGWNQQWQLQDVGGGYYKIVARHSAKVLDVRGGGTGDGDQVIQYEYQGHTNQQWRLEPI